MKHARPLACRRPILSCTAVLVSFILLKMVPKMMAADTLAMHRATMVAQSRDTWRQERRNSSCTCRALGTLS